jgi:phosphatidylglycerophosphate synthase
MMFERACGMSILERHLFILARAGLRRVFIPLKKPSPDRMSGLRRPEGLDIVWTSSDNLSPEPPYIAVSGDHFVRQEVLESLLASAHGTPVSFRDPAGARIAQFIPFRDAQPSAFENRPLSGDSFIPLTLPADRGPVPRWLMRDAVKAQDSFLARNFDRRISLAITNRIIDTPVTPNMMTVFSTFVGLAGAGLMAGGRLAMAAGAFLVWAHTILDGCDGEISRLRHQQSRLGGVIDFWGDNAVHAALFLCLGAGVWRAGHCAFHLALGFAASASALASAWLVFKRSESRSRSGEPLFQGLQGLGSRAPSEAVRRLAAVEDMLSRRDFVYLLVFLTWIGWARAFLWAAGLGSPLFLAALLYLKSLERQGEMRK